MLMFVRPFVSSLSGAVNLHLSRSEITQITLESTQSIEIRVKQSEPKILRLVILSLGKKFIFTVIDD